MTIGPRTARRIKLAAAALLPLLGSAPAFAQQSVLNVVRISGEADLIRTDRAASLRPSDTMQAGDEVRTGPDGHIGLALPAVGQITLGRDSRLGLHSIEAVDPPARMNLARLVVHAGSAQLDSRGAGGLPPADIRLNVGSLRLRIFGAAAWIQRGETADEVCLLGGAIELQGPSGPQRLDEVGSCARGTASGIAVLDPQAAGPLAARLALTAFPGDPTTLASASASGAPAPEPRRAPTPAEDPLAFGYAAPPELQARRQTAESKAPATPARKVADPAPNPATPDSTPRFVPYTASATVSADGELRLTPAAWTIVLASVPDPARAEQEATRLRKTGLMTQVVESARGDAKTWRVVSGNYADKQRAQADLREVRRRKGLASAWLTQLP
ncbi:MAG TPA: SPOR domain-containing protein [Fontimonas sp.]